MEKFKIAVAQIPSEEGNLDKNIELHMNAVELAQKYSVSIIVFPELSLSGYDLDMASRQALPVHDKRLSVFQEVDIALYQAKRDGRNCIRYSM